MSGTGGGLSSLRGFLGLGPPQRAVGLAKETLSDNYPVASFLGSPVGSRESGGSLSRSAMQEPFCHLEEEEMKAPEEGGCPRQRGGGTSGTRFCYAAAS